MTTKDGAFYHAAYGTGDVYMYEDNHGWKQAPNTINTTNTAASYTITYDIPALMKRIKELEDAVFTDSETAEVNKLDPEECDACNEIENLCLYHEGFVNGFEACGKRVEDFIEKALSP